MKDCPFCGSRPHFYTRDNDSFVKDVVVQCGGCFAEVTTNVDWQPFYANGSDYSGFNDAVAKAAADAWNRRPSNALIFDITQHGEDAAGIPYSTDTITVEVESGNPGGEEGEFAEYMAQCLREWYDGAKVDRRKGR